MALPILSTRINAAAWCQVRTKASAGTDNIWMKYPNKVMGQNSPVRSFSTGAFSLPRRGRLNCTAAPLESSRSGERNRSSSRSNCGQPKPLRIRGSGLKAEHRAMGAIAGCAVARAATPRRNCRIKLTHRISGTTRFACGTRSAESGGCSVEERGLCGSGKSADIGSAG